MSAKLITAVSVLLLTGPMGVAVAPATADHHPVSTVSAQASPLMKKKCVKAFKRDNRGKLHYRANVAWKTYEQHRASEQVMYDQLRWFLADPNAQEAIPELEKGAAEFLALLQPTVAKQRDKLYKDLDTVRGKYLTNGCLPSKHGKQVFKEAMRFYKNSADDIFKVQERLFAANMAVQTAQADLAGQALQDADLEFATVEENAIRCNELLEILY